MVDNPVKLSSSTGVFSHGFFLHAGGRQIYEEFKEPFLTSRAKIMDSQGEAAKVARLSVGELIVSS